MKKTLLLAAAGLLTAGLLHAQTDETLLLRQPTLSKTHLAFSYAGDLWVAGRDGSQPRRLTVAPGNETGPVFSPDGRQVAFTANYDGNTDVYVLPVEGGEPRRITWHPGPDMVRGWSPDGKSLLLLSAMQSATLRHLQLFTVPVAGGLPRQVPIEMMGSWASFSPDGTELAYTPIADAFGTWKRYRGGMTTPIRLLKLASMDSEIIPHENASDVQPLWMGSKVYFLSDRNRIMNVFEYDRSSKKVKQVTDFKDFDVKTLQGDGSTLVLEQAGRIHILDPASGKVTPLSIRIQPEVLAVRPGWRNVSNMVRGVHLSPGGLRAVVEARGDIYTVPVKKGDWRNLSHSDGTHDRNPLWSPDGGRIAWVSDASGEYQLMLQDQKGERQPETISLGDPSFYRLMSWAPDGKKILYGDKKMNLWYMDLATRKPVKITQDTYGPNSTIEAGWSPDSRWVAFSKKMDNYMRSVYLYELATGRSIEVTDGRSDATNPVFSRDGKYLFFAASTNTGLQVSGLDMSGYDRLSTSNLYLVVLDKNEVSPFAPESDEEQVKAEERKADEKKEADRKDADKKEADKKDADPKAEDATKGKKELVVKIDAEGIDQRILALPIGAANLQNLETADGGRLFYIDYGIGEAKPNLYRFDLKERKADVFMANVGSYDISADGKKLLYRSGPNLGIVEVGGKPAVGDGKVDVSGLQARIDPRNEWKQMLGEFWRIERDYFYVPNYHGVDWPGIRAKYARFLPHVASRSDLNYLIGEMMGEMVIGHNYVSGGDFPDVKNVPVGLLGADYELVNGSYRFKKVFSGEHWNPSLRAPLTAPGVNVKPGDYLLAVNGTPLTASDNVYGFFENLVGRQVTLTVSSQPKMEGSRQVVVVPIASETPLRQMAWVEENRRKVDAATGGKVAYVYLPNTGSQGYEFFNRYYYSQLDKQAVIIDERYNGGGMVADYIIDMLNRPLLSYWAPRDGKPYSSPAASIYGPKVMIINEYAGSGGDALPHFFRRRQLGTIVGKRTWGGLVGISGYPPLLDGGSVTAPSFGIYSPDGKWEVENVGVSPDIEVEMDPKLTAAGKDPQLEKAIAVVMEQLSKAPVKKVPVPKPDNRAVE